MFFEINFAEVFAERVAEVADFTPEQAIALEFGATTVIGIMSQMTSELEQTPEGEAAITALFDLANPYIETLRQATIAAQNADEEADEPEVEEEVEEEFVYEQDPASKAIDDLIEGLFASLIGPEAAAEVRAQVEAEDRARAEAEAINKAMQEPVDSEWTDEDDAALESEVEEFFAALFGGSQYR